MVKSSDITHYKISYFLTWMLANSSLTPLFLSPTCVNTFTTEKNIGSD